VVVWLLWQALVPMRHFLIPGDGRFTYEGLSFSWRLKTEVHHCFGHALYLGDTQLISRHPTGRAQIHWPRWQGERVIYREVVPDRISWPALPEIMVLLEPIAGERIVFNPLSRSFLGIEEADSRQRVEQIWREVYGREPEVFRMFALSDALESIERALRHTPQGSTRSREVADLLPAARQLDDGRLAPDEARGTLTRVRELLVDLSRQAQLAHLVRPIVRRIHPFALEGQGRFSVPFLVIEDEALLTRLPGSGGRINRGAWRDSPYTRDAQDSLIAHSGGHPLVVYVGGVGLEAKDLLPLAYIRDIQGHPEHPPLIRWNSLKDLTLSKYMHTSGQAFYLRRYARRVASLWEQEYGRRPKVHALSTEMSLNGRTHQLLVDPSADLASVPASWFRHNSWIKDLEMPRIPRDALHGPPQVYSYASDQKD
jgi:hypothetical protein